MPEIRLADPSATDAVVETLHRAFFDDPFSRYVFPDPADRDRLHPGMMRNFVDLAFATGEIYAVADYAAVAMWFPIPPSDEDLDFVERTAAACEAYGERFMTLAETLEHHYPTAEPHHHLQFLATVPERQSRGLGGLLLRDRLRELDATGTPAYLESSTSRSAALYEREGFKRTTPFAFPNGPTALPMWRVAGGMAGRGPAVPDE